jgi:hypothetical protein
MITTAMAKGQRCTIGAAAPLLRQFSHLTAASTTSVLILPLNNFLTPFLSATQPPFNTPPAPQTQYDIKLAEGATCGGAYLKFVTDDPSFDPVGLKDDTPYTIMFGPDKCGATNKVCSRVCLCACLLQGQIHLGSYFPKVNGLCACLCLNGTTTPSKAKCTWTCTDNTCIAPINVTPPHTHCVQVHLIIRHKSPLTGTIEEKHLKFPPLIVDDKKTHVYTAILYPGNNS